MKEIYDLAFGFFDEYYDVVLPAVTLSIMSSSCEAILIPQMISNVINDIEDMTKFRNNLILLIVIWIIIRVVYYGSNYYRRQLDPEITKYTTIKLLEKIFNKYEHENVLTNVSVLVSKILLLKRTFQEFIYIVFNVFVPRIITLILGCISIFIINPKIGICFFVYVVFQLYIPTLNIQECIDVSLNENNTKDLIYEYIEDVFYNIDTIELTPNGFDNELKKIVELSDQMKKIEQDTLDCVINKQTNSNASNFIMTCLMFTMIYYLYSTKEIGSKKVTQIILLLTGMFDNLGEIMFYIPEATAKFGLLKNNEEFLKEISYDSTKDKLRVNKNMKLGDKYDIKFVDATFSFENHKIIDNYSITIPSGSFVCIYGPSGSGKSTFINLIFGIENIQSGKIFIGDNDISTFHLREIRKQISYLNQNTTTLFSTTVYKNIIYGNDDTEEIRERIKKNFTDFNFYKIFENLDMGKDKWSFLDEHVGKLGENLSGGQKQIIHLLRLDLNNTSKIVILDEPSSALDDQTRVSASKYIEYLNKKGKTIILISHDDFYKEICKNTITFDGISNPVFS